MGEVFIPGLVLSPAPGNLPAQHCKFSRGWLLPGITLGEMVTAGLHFGHFRLEDVDLPPGAGLSSIKRPCVQKEGTPNSMALQIDHAGCDERAHPPIKPKHIPHGRPPGGFWDGNLDDKIEDGIANSIWLFDFPQAGSQDLPLFHARKDKLRQDHFDRLFPPVACPLA